MVYKLAIKVEMTRFLIVIMAFSIILVSCSGEAAMKEMTNDFLKQVEGDSDVSSYQIVNSSIDIVDVSPQEIELSRFETELRSLKQNQNYIKFFLLLNKLGKISKRNNYKEILDSKYFLVICLNIKACSEHCRKNLAVLETTTTNYNIKKLLNTQRKLFEEVILFYDCLSDYHHKKGKSPDLKKLITKVRSRQDFFETEYNKLKISYQN